MQAHQNVDIYHMLEAHVHCSTSYTSYSEVVCGVLNASEIIV
jgi:hypothetical protein